MNKAKQKKYQEGILWRLQYYALTMSLDVVHEMTMVELYPL